MTGEPGRARSGSAEEAGSASLITVVFSGLVGIVAVGVVAIGGLLTAREQATTAAEAAALAAAVATYPPAAPSGPPLGVAARQAAANGALLVRCVCPVDNGLGVRVVEVVAEVVTRVPLFGEFPIRGGARAEFDPLGWLGISQP